jgi:hypothetical protein
MSRSILSLLLLCAACGSTPPPKVEAPKPPPEPPPPPKVEAPPPKKCEALSEGCVAEDATKARASGVTIGAPKGWTYAHGPAALARQGEAALAVTVHDADPKSIKLDGDKRDAALADLLKQLEVTPPKKKIYWTLPPLKKLTVGALAVSLWQMDGASHGGKHGPLLLFVAKLPESKSVLGVGFVPDDDKSGADVSILKAIETLDVQAEAAKKP